MTRTVLCRWHSWMTATIAVAKPTQVSGQGGVASRSSPFQAQIASLTAQGDKQCSPPPGTRCGSAAAVPTVQPRLRRQACHPPLFHRPGGGGTAQRVGKARATTPRFERFEPWTVTYPTNQSPAIRSGIRQSLEGMFLSPSLRCWPLLVHQQNCHPGNGGTAAIAAAVATHTGNSCTRQPKIIQDIYTLDAK